MCFVKMPFSFVIILSVVFDSVLIVFVWALAGSSY